MKNLIILFMKGAALSFALLTSLLLPSLVGAEKIGFHKFASIEGGTIDTEQWKGKPYLVINTASRCGFTKQYAGLQELYDKYHGEGFGMVAVPSDDFNQELDSNAEVKNFCEINYGINMPMSETMSVRGQEAHQFFKDVKAHSGFAPKWNFNKILIGSNGKVVGTWGSLTKPMATKLTKAIENELSVSQQIRLRYSTSPRFPHGSTPYETIVWLAGELLQLIEAKGTKPVILELDSKNIYTATGKLIVNMMVSIAQLEHEVMMERQVKGIKRPKANTKVPYKGCAHTTTQQTKKVKARATAGVGRLQVMEQLGMSKASDYRYLSSI